MDEKALTPKPDLALVKPSSKEKMLYKLEKFKIQGVTPKEKKELDEKERSFAENFIELCYKNRHVGLFRPQLSKLNNQDLKELDNALSQSVRPWACFQAAAMIGICVAVLGLAVAGAVVCVNGIIKIVLLSLVFVVAPGMFAAGPLAVIGDSAKSLNYLWTRRTLKKVYGRDYFPNKAVREELKWKQDWED